MGLPLSGVVSSPTSLSGTSGLSPLASRSSSSTADVARNCTECASIAAWIHGWKPSLFAAAPSRKVKPQTNHKLDPPGLDDAHLSVDSWTLYGSPSEAINSSDT